MPQRGNKSVATTSSSGRSLYNLHRRAARSAKKDKRAKKSQKKKTNNNEEKNDNAGDSSFVAVVGFTIGLS